jgi:cobalt-zinc-cadmium resistance protein CzcA
MPMEVADAMVILKDKSEWTSAKTKEELMSKMEETLDDIPGVTTEFTQPIQMRFNELMTGVRSDVAVKIFGEDIDLLASLAEQVMPMIQSVEGVEDARPEAVSGLPQITVKYNKDKLALYGLNVGDLNQVVRTGFAGEKAGVVYEGEKRFDLVVRLQNDSRQDIENLKNLYVSLPSGSQIPLEQVADIAFEPGPIQVSREDGKRRIVIGFNVRGRDVKSVVNEIQAKLDAKLKMPPGYYTTYGGQFQNLVEANKRLSVAVPVALALIFVLLFFTFGSIKQSLLIFTAIPLSAIGGVFALVAARDAVFDFGGRGFYRTFWRSCFKWHRAHRVFQPTQKRGHDRRLATHPGRHESPFAPRHHDGCGGFTGLFAHGNQHRSGRRSAKTTGNGRHRRLDYGTLLTLIVLPILYFFLRKS